MLDFTKKQLNKAVPYFERFAKWVVRTAFELLQLGTVGLTTMSLINGHRVVEYAMSGLMVAVTFAVTRTKVMR